AHFPFTVKLSYNLNIIPFTKNSKVTSQTYNIQNRNPFTGNGIRPGGIHLPQNSNFIIHYPDGNNSITYISSYPGGKCIGKSGFTHSCYLHRSNKRKINFPFFIYQIAKCGVISHISTSNTS